MFKLAITINNKGCEYKLIFLLLCFLEAKSLEEQLNPHTCTWIHLGKISYLIKLQLSPNCMMIKFPFVVAVESVVVGYPYML